MPLTANQGAAWNISDCFILSSGIAFFKKGTFQKLHYYSWPTFLHEKHFPFKNYIEKWKRRKFSQYYAQSIFFLKGKPNIRKDSTDFFLNKEKSSYFLWYFCHILRRKTRKIAALVKLKFEFKKSEKDLHAYLLLTLLFRV